MSKMIKIGNVRDIGAKGGGNPKGLGGRIRSLTQHAMDRGEAVVKQAIDDLTLEEELSPEEQEALAEGLDYIAAILEPHRGPACRQAKVMVRGLYDAIGAFDQVDGDGAGDYGAGDYDSEDEDDDLGGIVDVIGLDGAGGFVREPRSGSNDDWR